MRAALEARPRHDQLAEQASALADEAANVAVNALPKTIANRIQPLMFNALAEQPPQDEVAQRASELASAAAKDAASAVSRGPRSAFNGNPSPMRSVHADQRIDPGLAYAEVGQPSCVDYLTCWH